MLTSLERLNASRSGQEPLRIGIALHAGVVLVGTIGAPSRRQYTIVGDAVNVTDRLEKHNKELGSVLIASAAALSGLDPGRLGFLGPVRIAIRGREEPIAAYELSGGLWLGGEV
jgi:adenylate cyclase